MGVDIHKAIGKIPFKPKRGFVLPKHRYTGPYNPHHLQLDSKERPGRSRTMQSMQSLCAIEITSGKQECDRKMLAELNALTPRGRREKVDKQLVQGIIGLRHRLGMGVRSSQPADELHKPVRKRFRKPSVFAKEISDIWTADLVDMSPYSRSNSGYKYLLTVIDVFSKNWWIIPLKTKTGKEVAMAFQKLFTITNASPSRRWTYGILQPTVKEGTGS